MRTPDERKLRSNPGAFRIPLGHVFVSLLVAVFGLDASGQSIGRVQSMPAMPQPYEMRDWDQVTRSYLDFVFDFSKEGNHLPLVRWKDEAKTSIWMPAYVGNPDGTESINYLAAIVSGSLVGIDMCRFKGVNWVTISTNFYNPADGIFLDWPQGESGGSFWYDVFPNVLYYQLGCLYPDEAAKSGLMRKVAERWFEACMALGGRTNPLAIPSFDHTGFKLRTMTPFDNGRRIEPEGAAGIGWIQYMAWLQFKDPRFLAGADWAITALQRKPLERNPLYEVLLPYSVIAAARMNAELGRTYDVDRLVNWCFEPRPKPQARPNWGVITGSWSGLDVHGLVGSVTDGGGYAFAMNTFQYVGTLAPLARYDQRYAKDLGKWILNAANASRLFYGNAHDAEHQSSYEWSSRYDTNSIIAYEGLRKWKRSSSAVARNDYQTRAGRCVRGSFADTHYFREAPPKVQVLGESPSGNALALEHIWTFDLPAEKERFLVVAVRDVKDLREGNSFRFSYSTEPGGPYSQAFTITKSDTTEFVELPASLQGALYLKVESGAPSGGKAATIGVDAMAISFRSDLGPYAQGDLIVSFVSLVKNSTVPIVLYRPKDAVTDLGLYGSSHVGNLGGVVRKSNVERILQVDVVKTDYFGDKTYPTYLYYNPYPEKKEIEVDVGADPKDIYDSVTKKVMVQGARGKARFEMPPDSAVVAVICPGRGKTTYEGSRRLVNGVVVDWKR